MEYLVTYGLALFVILIVLAILVAVVLPSLRAPETCQFTQPGFGCSTKNHVLVADSAGNVDLIFQLDNQQGRGVVILGVLCTTEVPGNIDKEDMDEGGIGISESMPAGSSRSFGTSEADVTNEIRCMDGTDTLVLAANDDFRGTLAIEYRFSQDVPGAPTRLAVASLTGTVQEGEISVGGGEEPEELPPEEDE